MFAKLIKYEMKSMLKIFLLAWGAILVVALVLGLMAKNSVVKTMDDNYFFVNNLASFSGVFEGISILLYVALVVGIIVLSLIFVISRFNKGLLGSEGYLMFTLPTTPRALIISKGIAATLIVIISGVVGILSVMLMLFATGSLSDIGEVFQGIGELFAQYSFAIPTMILAVVVLILSIINFIYHIYTSIALGHLFAKHRTLMAVVAFVGISIVVNVIRTIVLTIGLEIPGFDDFLINEWTWNYVSLMFLAVVGVDEIIGIVIYHVLTEYILKNRLNLE